MLLCRGQPAEKKKVRSEGDLPRFSYRVTGTAADLLQSSPESFGPFAAKVRTDLQSIFDNYEIEDKSTRRTLLDAKLSLEEMAGENEAALNSIKSIRSSEEKPYARLMTDVVDEAMLHARIDTHSTSGSAYEKAFAHRFSEALSQLHGRVVQEPIKQIPHVSRSAKAVLDSAFHPVRK